MSVPSSRSLVGSLTLVCRWKPFDPARNWPDLGARFFEGERTARLALKREQDGTSVSGSQAQRPQQQQPLELDEDKLSDDQRDLDWATVLKRTFESYIRGERPNMYGEWLLW